MLHHLIACPARRAYYRTRWLLARHPLIALLWALAVAAMVAATAWGHAPMARAALFLALVALLASMVATARWVIARMTHIVALWEEDVPLASNATNLYPLHRGERAKDHA